MALDGAGGSIDDETASGTISSSLSSDSLTTDGGTWINWSRLISVAIGFLSTVWFTRIAEFIDSIIQAFAIGPVTAVGDILAAATSAMLGAIPVSIRASFQPAASFLREIGPSAFVIAMVIVVATAYVVARELNRDG
jgi:hypothetical protein